MIILIKPRIRMNKRGDIPVTILVIGVLVICMLAIVSFYISASKVKSGFNSLGVVEQSALLKEKMDFYGREGVGLSQQEIDKIIGIKSDRQGRHFILEQGKISVRYNVP